MFLWATAWTVVILIITGIALSTLYRHAVERAFDRRLDVYLRTLVAEVASPEEGNDKFPQSIGEPLFELPLSGWYWQVTRLDTPKPELHSSRSLWDSNLDVYKRQVEDCVRLTPESLKTITWLPPSCAYVLLAEGKDLYWWHPLVSGDPETVHTAGVSVRGRVGASEKDVPDDMLEDYIVSWPLKLPKGARRKR